MIYPKGSVLFMMALLIGSSAYSQGFSEGPPSYSKNLFPRIFQPICSACHNSASTIPNWLDYSVASRMGRRRRPALRPVSFCCPSRLIMGRFLKIILFLDRVKGTARITLNEV